MGKVHASSEMVIHTKESSSMVFSMVKVNSVGLMVPSTKVNSIPMKSLVSAVTNGQMDLLSKEMSKMV
jgi:hypothetical protein